MSATSQDKALFEDYDGFVEKFKQKKTTDDCYTPENIYDVIADWVANEYGLSRTDFVRPFYPGGDYERYDYPEGCVVVDNPPFSILARICDFYVVSNIKFFLFASALTFAHAHRHIEDLCVITSAVNITYENGAIVPTSFVTNLDTCQLRTAPDLFRLVDTENQKNCTKKRTALPKYGFPNCVLTASMAQQFSKYGVDYRVAHGDAVIIRALDAQRPHKKSLYGGGLLLSEKATTEKIEAEKKVAEKTKAIVWELSDREQAIVAGLGKDKRREE